MTENEDWKTRYLEEARAWESREALLRRAIGRLALAAEGADGKLDRILRDVQTHARGGDERALALAIDALSACVKQLDTGYAGASPSGEGVTEADYCAQLIEALDLAPRLHDSLMAFRRKLPQLQPQECLVEMAACISALLHLDEAPGDNSYREMLLTLIDEVARVQPALDGLHALRDTVAAAPEDAPWREHLASIIDEIRVAIERMTEEKKALEQLMVDITDELGDISSVLAEDVDSREEGREHALALHAVLDSSVKQIQAQVDQETDIAALKSGVSRSLVTMRTGISEFIARDAERYARAEARNHELQRRLAAMEQEAQQLKDNLDDSRKQLMYDTLTGVSSRLAYDESLAQELRRYRRYREPFCFAMLDIDHFKKVNDSYGHAAGDEALKLVASLIAGRIRETDALFRVGGEEFVLILPRTGLAASGPLVELLRQAVGESGFHFEGEPVQITLSAGLTAVHVDDTPLSIYERADDAMYRAKTSGRDCLVTLE